MALDKLRRELNEKAAQAERAERERQKAIAEREQAFLEYKKSQQPAFKCLQLLEDFFWECVDDYSRLANLRIKRTNRSDSAWLFRLLGISSSSATILEPELYVRYESGEWTNEIIKLEVFLPPKDSLEESWQGLQFTAEYSTEQHRIPGGIGRSTPYERHVLVCEKLPIESFEIQAARKWLESNFERYYREFGNYLDNCHY